MHKKLAANVRFQLFVEGKTPNYFRFSCQLCNHKYLNLNAKHLSRFLEIRNDASQFLHDPRIFNLDECKKWFKSDKRVRYILIIEDYRIIGYFRFELKNSKIMYIGMDLYSDQRNQGKGFKAYQCMLNHVGIKYLDVKLKLEVLGDNYRAIKLYEKIGFKIKKQQELIVNGRKVNNLIMEYSG